MKTVTMVLSDAHVAKLDAQLKRLWDNYVVIGDVRKNNKIKFVVGSGIRDGVQYLNIREFYLRQRDGVWKPGRDGITVPVIVPVEKGTVLLKPYEGLTALLAEAIDAFSVMELFDEENAVYVEPKERKKV